MNPNFKFVFDFEKFPVYMRSEELYVAIIGVLRNQKIDRIIRDQFKRAALSIVLNIAEGAGKFSKNDKKNFYVISKGSVNECVAIVRILRLEKLIDDNTFREIYNDLFEIAKMLSGLIRSMIQ